ncbi:hypothetical protein DPMN_064131 [Dreissena polymorpha]|uniref:Uncharacterized protein n=1 Tax=Dreissena polymorpha TaxID=45954 RepID=A0A9D4CBR3_DREPO|nr:hypothetical protein DPMN_064131 [Dreissena polymorpha]
MALLQPQQQQQKQDPIQSQFGTQLNYMLSGELELDAQGQFLSIGVEILGQEFGAKLNESYPQGTATLTLGLHTSLLRGRDYLIYKGPYPHKFRPRKPCFSTATQPLHLNNICQLEGERKRCLNSKTCTHCCFSLNMNCSGSSRSNSAHNSTINSSIDECF